LKKIQICKRQSDFTVKDMKRPPSACGSVHDFIPPPEFLAVVFSDFIGLVILFQKLLKLDHIARWSNLSKA